MPCRLMTAFRRHVRFGPLGSVVPEATGRPACHPGVPSSELLILTDDYLGDPIENGTLPSTMLASCIVLTIQCSVYLPGGKVDKSLCCLRFPNVWQGQFQKVVT